MLRKIRGGIITFIGYLLSPFSWWNDFFLNIPIAYGIGFLFGLISRSWFFPAMVIGYWLTNIVGLILVHYGIIDLITGEKRRYTKKDLLRDFILSILYTLLIIVLIKFGILKFPLDYFK